MRQSLLLLFAFSALLPILSGQDDRTATLYGTVTDAASGQPLEFVTVYLVTAEKAAETNEEGFFLLQVPAGEPLEVRFSRVGFKAATASLTPTPSGSRRRLDIQLASLESDVVVEVVESRIADQGMIVENVEAFKILPNASGNFESILPSIALGTNSGTGGELSSQYNVRGGNYDENLVYVNDFAIYRPQLIRTGQQEGLTFPNIDLMRNLSFSSGGFEARYGDKLSSVLDVQYKRPDSTRASVSMSFLGASAHLEGSKKLGGSAYRRLRYLVGARYKTTRYLLGSLDIQGEYIPNFYDLQAYVTYDLNRDWQLAGIANYNRSEYNFTPSSRITATGLIDFTLQLFTVFEGQEIDDFTTAMGGLSLTWLPEDSRHPVYLKFLGSAFRIDENEAIDISGFYNLGQIESNPGSDNFGEVVSLLGSGTEQTFVRNNLTSTIANFEHKGGIELQVGKAENWKTSASHFIQWGLKYQREEIDDRINEWERLDSAGYSLPFDATTVQLNQVFKSTNILTTNVLSGFLQNTWSYRRDSVAEWSITAGVRANYRDLNGELLVSPRIQINLKPLGGKGATTWRLAGGLYAQPPFYREMRNPQGIVNSDLLAQKSLHIVGGMTHEFFMGLNKEKPFKFIAEAYYKRLWDVVSYDIDNVRIRYSGLNDAEATVMGLDMRINGEFVPGAESWVNLSLLRVRERLLGVSHLKYDQDELIFKPVKNVPRPTDQLVTLSMFFQDYLPQNENFKMNMMLTVGTGLPYGFPQNNVVTRNAFRFRPYHRVDIGFSLLLWDRSWSSRHPGHFLRFTRSAWVSLEVFNLLQVANPASNTWIKTITNVQYAIPNFLTSRRINLRLRFDF